MKRQWVMLLAVMLLVIASTVSAAVVTAGGEDGKVSAIDKLSSKVAAILGLDEEVVDGAIKQARTELKEEAVQSKVDAYEAKLSSLVEQGELTQEQADEKLQWLQSGSKDTLVSKKKAFSYEGLEKKLAIMVDKGVLTQEQADKKLDSVLAKKEAHEAKS